MKKSRFWFYCLLSSLLLILADYTFAQQQIGKISTVGNTTINSSQILTRVRSRVGDVFDPKVADEDAKRIAELPGIQYSYYNAEKVQDETHLTFVVVEKNLVRSIIIFGNRKYKSKKLKEKLSIKVGDYFDEMLAESSRKALLEFYRGKGYASSQIALDITKLPRGQLVYTVGEGPRTKIKSVNFSGNKAIESEQLKKIIKVKKRKLFFLRNYYVEEKLAGEVARLQDAYYEQGFMDVSIKRKTEFSDDKKRVNIVYDIKEGTPYTVGNINITGAEYFGEPNLLTGFKLENEQIFNQRTYNSDVDWLLKRYRESGFVDAKLDKKVTFVPKNKVNVEFDISAGQRFRIGKIDITGNDQTQDKVVRRVLDEFDFKPGQWYNAHIVHGDGTGELEKDVRYMVMSESVAITPGQESPGQKDARVNIVEGQTGSVMLGAGVASDSGVIGQLVFDQRNFDINNKPESFIDFITGRAFKGAGQHLRIALEPGTELSQYSVSFTEPYFKNKPISLDVLGSSWQRIRESHDEERLKGYVGFERRLKNKWRRSIGLRVESVELTDLDIDVPKEIIDDKGSDSLVGVKLGVSRIMTDDRYNPTKGYTFRANYEQVGGDNMFGILSGTYRKYRTIYEDLAERKTVLATKLHAATAVGDAPVYEKFYAGGSHSIRGFDYRGVSPRGLPTLNGVPVPGSEKKDPIGSDWLFLANAEIIMPLVSDNLAMLFFVDSGAVDTGNYRASIGTGIQILIPQWFGPVPMRFEIAAPFLKDGEDETQIFSFSVGRLF